MKLKKIYIKNFYSIREMQLDFTKYSGIVQVIGKNKDTGGSNGSGKSSVFEAVVWGLFGKTIRKSTEEALINCDAKRNCEVILEVEREGVGTLCIHRGKKPTFLRFIVESETKTQDHATHTQELIEKTLDTDYKTFVAAILFGQHVDIDFLSSSADDKRNIIRNFLNLDNIFSLRDRIREIKSSYSTKAKISEALISEHEVTLKEKQTKLESLNHNEDDAKIFTESLEEVMKREDRIRKLEETVRECKGDLTYLDSEIRQVQSKLNKINVDGICPSCKESLSAEKKETIKKEAEGQLEDLMAKAKKAKDRKKNCLKEIEEYKLKPSLKQYLSYMDRCKEKDSAETYKKDILDLKTKIENNSKIKQEAEIGYDVMRFWEKAFSEQGLIKYFIKNILDFFNAKTNEYLSQLTNNQFTIKFDEELEETICNNGRNIAFISLSGGEKRKINLAVMLSLQTLLSATAKKQSNIVFFDEVADNLDDDGILCLYNLLNSLKGDNRTIFLITHNNYLKSLLDSTQFLTIMKTRGESKLIENV